MGKVHHQIRLRILSCSRVSENHREPEVPKAEVPVVECLDGLARITFKELANNSFCEKWHPPECLFYKTKSGCRFVEKCSFAHRQVDEQPTKRSKKNDDKSAVAILKKGDWHERGPVTDQGQGNLIRDVLKSWDEDLLNVDCLMHDNWVAYFKT